MSKGENRKKINSVKRKKNQPKCGKLARRWVSIPSAFCDAFFRLFSFGAVASFTICDSKSSMLHTLCPLYLYLVSSVSWCCCCCCCYSCSKCLVDRLCIDFCMLLALLAAASVGERFARSIQWLRINSFVVSVYIFPQWLGVASQHEWVTCHEFISSTL